MRRTLERLIAAGATLILVPAVDAGGAPGPGLPPGAKVHFLGDSIFKGWGFGKYDDPSPLCRIQDICTLLARDNLAAPPKFNHLYPRSGEGNGPGDLVRARIADGEIGPADWILYEDAGPHDSNYKAYRRKLADIAKAASGAHRRVVFMTMFDYNSPFPDSAYDAPTRDVPSKTTNDAIRDEAADQHAPVIDMNRAMDSLQEYLAGHGWGSTCHRDGVHPNVFGNLMMALVILRASGIEIDAWKLDAVDRHVRHPESGGDVPDMKGWRWPKDPNDEERRGLVRAIHKLALEAPIERAR